MGASRTGEEVAESFGGDASPRHLSEQMVDLPERHEMAEPLWRQVHLEEMRRATKTFSRSQRAKRGSGDVGYTQMIFESLLALVTILERVLFDSCSGHIVDLTEFSLRPVRENCFVSLSPDSPSNH